MARRLLILILTGYRQVISPLLPPSCRFYPTCSAYTQGAIAKYGIVKGLVYGLGRIGRCHPWHPGGYDPIR